MIINWEFQEMAHEWGILPLVEIMWWSPWKFCFWKHCVWLYWLNLGGIRWNHLRRNVEFLAKNFKNCWRETGQFSIFILSVFVEGFSSEITNCLVKITVLNNNRKCNEEVQIFHCRIKNGCKGLWILGIFLKCLVFTQNLHKIHFVIFVDIILQESSMMLELELVS